MFKTIKIMNNFTFYMGEKHKKEKLSSFLNHLLFTFDHNCQQKST